ITLNAPPLRTLTPLARRVSTSQRATCSACGHSGIEEILALPQLPLTGVFVDPAERHNFPAFDQALLRCATCGHAQLRESVDPAYLYQDTYTHRSSLSPISTRGNDFFLSFLNEVTAGRRFQSVVEIGCNDLYLLKKISLRGDRLAGFDPIWRERAPSDTGEIQVSGKYIEEIDPANDFPGRPDLVLSVHTLEHVNHPLDSLRPIFDYARPGALFIVEVPSMDTLLTIGRFDQVFHQHLNYFSLASFGAMIRGLGGEYIAHRFNYGYWLGTMLVAFRKPAHPPSCGDSTAQLPAAPATATIRRQHAKFRAQLEGVRETIERLIEQGAPAVGFGAAQMVPTLAYHMQTDLGFLDVIIDDNPLKSGLSYPSIATTIRPATEFPDLAKHAVLLTACDSARGILPRLCDLRARYIVNPCNPF
ncbi:MAG: methyltransferase domain-containing protein, partial [Opitutae bacterium]|nr:methyltransferase domain-containing protein [Opitutae bacterium]